MRSMVEGAATARQELPSPQRQFLHRREAQEPDDQHCRGRAENVLEHRRDRRTIRGGLCHQLIERTDRRRKVVAATRAARSA